MDRTRNTRHAFVHVTLISRFFMANGATLLLCVNILLCLVEVRRWKVGNARLFLGQKIKRDGGNTLWELVRSNFILKLGAGNPSSVPTILLLRHVEHQLLSWLPANYMLHLKHVSQLAAVA